MIPCIGQTASKNVNYLQRLSRALETRRRRHLLEIVYDLKIRKPELIIRSKVLCIYVVIYEYNLRKSYKI